MLQEFLKLYQKGPHQECFDIGTGKELRAATSIFERSSEKFCKIHWKTSGVGWFFDKVIRCRPARTYSREKEHVSSKTRKVTIIVENKGMCTGQKGKKVQLWAQLSFFP